MKKCLWVVPKAIFPVRDGARVANQALLKSLRGHFSEVDVMLFNEADSDETHLASYDADFNPTHVYFLKRASFPNILLKLIFLGRSFLSSPTLPVTTGYFHTARLKDEVSKILKTRNYDAVVFDGLHPFAAFRELPGFDRLTVIYRAHNVEADLWSTASLKTRNPLIKRLLLWQGKKMQDLEMDLVERSKRVWCIAEEDMRRFKELGENKDEKFVFIPVGLDFNTRKPNTVQDEKMKYLFLGKMDWAPNKDGLKWFLETVWPHVDHQKCELYIVGSGDASWGTELFRGPGIKFLGFVKDLDAVYSSCDFSLIPIHYGSGTRIKVIESISRGLPIVSTQMGVQGSGLHHYFKAEKSLEWVSLLNSLNKDQGKEMAEKAFQELESMYSPREIAMRAFESLRI